MIRIVLLLAMLTSLGLSFRASAGTFMILQQGVMASSTLACAASGTAYRYIRFVTTNIKTKGNSDDATSIDEWTLCWGGAWRTNAMTSNSAGTIGGISATVSASSEYNASYPGFKALDGSTSSFWNSAIGQFPGAMGSPSPPGMTWLKIDFGSGNSVAVRGYKVRGRTSYTNQAPTTFYVEGSDDGTNWTAIGSTQTNANTWTSPYFSVTF